MAACTRMCFQGLSPASSCCRLLEQRLWCAVHAHTRAACFGAPLQRSVGPVAAQRLWHGCPIHGHNCLDAPDAVRAAQGTARTVQRVHRSIQCILPCPLFSTPC